MKKSISILLIITGIVIGIYGMTGYVDNQTAVEIGDVNISKDLEITKEKNTMLNVVSVTGLVLTVIGIGGIIRNR